MLYIFFSIITICFLSNFGQSQFCSSDIMATKYVISSLVATGAIVYAFDYWAAEKKIFGGNFSLIIEILGNAFLSLWLENLRIEGGDLSSNNKLTPLEMMIRSSFSSKSNPRKVRSYLDLPFFCLFGSLKFSFKKGPNFYYEFHQGKRPCIAHLLPSAFFDFSCCVMIAETSGTTPKTDSNEWWEETDKKFQAWPRTAGPPVVMNPIRRQNFIVKSSVDA